MYSGKRILTNEVTTDEIYESGSVSNSLASTSEIYQSPSSAIYEELAVYSRPHFYDSIQRNEQNPPPSPLPPFKEPPKQQRLKQLKTGNPNKIEILKTYESKNYKGIEKWLHKKYSTNKTESKNDENYRFYLLRTASCRFTDE
jgi:hypothetical protein